MHVYMQIAPSWSSIQRLGPSNLLSVLLILPRGLRTVPRRPLRRSLDMCEFKCRFPASPRLKSSWYALPLPLPRGVQRFLVPVCDLSLPPLPCCARCFLRGLASAMRDVENIRVALNELEREDGLTGVKGERSAKKLGLAKAAMNRDVVANIVCARSSGPVP